jgi:membrane-associated phospholipid phosphatase
MLKQKPIPARWFLLPSLVVIATSLILLIAVPRSEIHMAVNGMHAPWLDILFKTWTLLGDGMVVLVIVGIMLFVRVDYFLIVFAGYAISGLSVQLLKRLFFSTYPRPVKYFELNLTDQELYLVPGVELHHWFSFPSGHTATAFGVFFCIALISNNKIFQFLLFVAALGVGFSRMYLSQHFLVDVTGGAAMGITGGYLSWWWIRRYDRPWMKRSLPKLLMHEAA